jgi:hypothetical protein
VDHRLARSMVNRSPWPALKLTRARPLAAPVTGNGIRWHGEMEGVSVRLTSGENKRGVGESGRRRGQVAVTFGARRGDDLGAEKAIWRQEWIARVSGRDLAPFL